MKIVKDERIEKATLLPNETSKIEILEKAPEPLIEEKTEKGSKDTTVCNAGVDNPSFCRGGAAGVRLSHHAQAPGANTGLGTADRFRFRSHNSRTRARVHQRGRFQHAVPVLPSGRAAIKQGGYGAVHVPYVWMRHRITAHDPPYHETFEDWKPNDVSHRRGPPGCREIM